MIADRKHLVGAGLCLIVGPAPNGDRRRYVVYGIEKEAMIFQHDLHDAARCRSFE
jgi:hypothetical protein